MFIKNIAFVACVMGFSSGQFYAFGSDYELGSHSSDNKIVTANLVAETAPVSNALPATRLGNQDPALLRSLFALAVARGVDPSNLRLVCKDWKMIIDEQISKDENGLINYNFVRYFALPPIWKMIVKSSYGGIGRDDYEKFLGGRLIYRETPEIEDMELPVSYLGNPFKGTFDLTKCGGVWKHLVITTDIERFFKVGGDNENKIVVLITLRNLVRYKIKSTAAIFEEILFDWDIYNWEAPQSPIGIFWKLGNSPKELANVDCLIKKTVSSLSSCNLYENWKKSETPLGQSVVPISSVALFLEKFRIDFEPRSLKAAA